MQTDLFETFPIDWVNCKLKLAEEKKAKSVVDDMLIEKKSCDVWSVLFEKTGKWKRNFEKNISCYDLTKCNESWYLQPDEYHCENYHHWLNPGWVFGLVLTQFKSNITFSMSSIRIERCWVQYHWLNYENWVLRIYDRLVLYWSSHQNWWPPLSMFYHLTKTDDHLYPSSWIYHLIGDRSPLSITKLILSTPPLSISIISPRLVTSPVYHLTGDHPYLSSHLYLSSINSPPPNYAWFAAASTAGGYNIPLTAPNHVLKSVIPLLLQDSKASARSLI